MQRMRYGDPKKKNHKKRTFTYEELRAVEHLARLGATNAQFAEYFEVDVIRIEAWKRNYRMFRSAVKKGGLIADVRVVNSLYKRANGYRYVEEEYSAIEIDGKEMALDQMRKVKRTIKVLPPDVKAALHWLKVRQREIWANTEQSTVLHVGSVNHLHQRLQDIPVHELTPAAQKMLFEITTKQLANSNSVN